MSDPSMIKQRLESLQATLRAKPALGKAPKTATIRVRAGTTCDVEVDGHKLVSDLPAALGGPNLGPVPGALLRASVGSCLAIGYVMWAAVLEIPLDEVEVTVEGEFDGRAALGLTNEVPTGYSAFNYTTKFRSAAPPQRLQELVDLVDRYSAVVDTVRRAVPVTGQLRLV